jgi:Flp pilus assembly pilin Flp
MPALLFRVVSDERRGLVMRAHLSSLWRDEAGFIVSAELVLLGTLLVVGLIAGLSCVQEAVIGEYQDVAGAIRSLDQSYAFSGMQGCISPQCGSGSWTAGSAYPPLNPACAACFDCFVPQVGDCQTCPPEVPVVLTVPEIPVEVALPYCVQPAATPIPCEVRARLPCVPPPTGEVACLPAIPAAVVRPCDCELSVKSAPDGLRGSGVWVEPLPFNGPLVW